MADYKWRTNGSPLCYGTDWLPPGTSPTIGWTDAYAGSNSLRTTHWIRNADNQSCKRQQVDFTVTNNWEVTFDYHNFMHVRLNCRLEKIYSWIYQGGRDNWVTKHIVVRPYDGGPIVSDFDYSPNFVGTIGGGVNMGEWTMIVPPGEESSWNSFYFSNWSVGYADEYHCNKYMDKITAGIQFKNDRAINYDIPTINSTECRGEGNGAFLSAAVDFGEYRPNTGNTVRFQIARDEEFTKIVSDDTRWGNGDRWQTISIIKEDLQPNTQYFARYKASNNSKESGWATCDFVTLTTNTLSDPQAFRWDKGQVRLAIQMGGGYYTNPSTGIWVKPCGTENWQLKVTRTTKTVADVMIEGLSAETCYDIQARTTTPAGTYNGNIVTFTTPKKNIATAAFTKIETAIDEEENDTHADMCYHYDSDIAPVDITVYYRVKNGSDPGWDHTDTVTFDEVTGDYCFTIHWLFPNQTVYETYIVTNCDGNEWTSDITEFITPLIPLPPNYICDDLQYLVDLICQAVTALYTGNKTIYANPTTKELCDPYSSNPTLATLWSRLLRFDHAAACVMCEMVPLSSIKGGAENQYYVGEIGWHNMATEVTEGDIDIVESRAIREYIDLKVHEVWHFHSSVDYLTGTIAEAPSSGLIVGDSAIEANSSKLYIWNGSNWEEDPDFEVDNFAVFHIRRELESSYGKVKAHQAYYYFEGTWNHLDADTRNLEDRAKRIEDTGVTDPQSESEDLMTIQTNNENFDYTTLPNGERVICFVVEDTNLPPRGSYRVTYETGENATIVPDEDVVAGATPQKPTDPEKTGNVFVRWEDKNNRGVEFDFSVHVLKNYDLIAIWDPKPVTVTFNIRPEIGTTGVPPEPQNLHYGDPVPRPGDSSFSLLGGVFAGWMREGVPIVEGDTLYGDTELVARFTMNEFDVVVHPENGEPNTIISCVAGTIIPEPAAPVRENYVFIGWYTARTGGQKIVDFSRTLYEPTDIWAHWVPASYEITFKPGGGNSDFVQTVNYMGTVTPPEAPIWRL